jgi:hypothetical protein
MSDDKDAAEDYRRQRQAAAARKSGFAPKILDEQLKWMEENAELVLAIARGSAGAQDDAQAVLEEYKKALLSTSPGSSYDDVNGRQIIECVIREIEQACHDHQIPIRSGVAYGISPEMGLLIAQRPVMQTASSIIDVTVPFLTFCNLVTKALAQSLPQAALENGQVQVSNDPAAVRARLQSSPALVTEWNRIFGSYAELGWPPHGVHLISDMTTQVVRLQLLRAVELFALAHEYGHHVMQHGVTDSSADIPDPFIEEHQADLFARGASMAIGSREPVPNLYAMFGVGAVVILGALDLVRRATALLESGSDQPPPRERHPPFRDRVKVIALLDQRLAVHLRPTAANMRDCFVQIMEVIWEFARPGIAELHANGVRPVPNAPYPGGWLPS